MRSSLGILVVLAACGGSSKPAAQPAAPEEEVATPIAEVDEEGDEWGPEEDEHGGVRPPPAAPVELDQLSLDNGGTGSLVCDELIQRMNCLYAKYPGQFPAEAVKAWEDGVKAWSEAIKNDATRQPTIEACQMSVDAGKPGFEAQGC